MSDQLAKAMAFRDTLKLAAMLNEDNFSDDRIAEAWQSWETDFGPELALALIREIDRLRAL